MSLSTGTRVGSYEIVSLLGAGGMGEVYRARDTKLGRDVAIKVLPELFAADSERLTRFQREAQLLAALNHPNIAAIFGLEDSGPTRFIVMELVEGESLADRLRANVGADPRVGPRGGHTGPPLQVGAALAIARQVIDALEAAHEKGIIHRDLKPANIMLTEDGQVKVLDFGLAKFEANESGGSSSAGGAGALTHSPTLTFAATQVGMILGTAAYMSPEQARGRPADKRSDVWGFGCVLYEMLAGKRVFDGDDVTDIIAAVVRAEPDWNALPPDTPAGMSKILQGCLQKDRKARIPDMSVVRYLFADTESAPAGHLTSPVTLPRRRVGAIAAIAAVAAAAVASVATWAFLRPVAPPKSAPMRFAIPQPAGRPFGMGAPDRAIVIAPDGAHIVSVHGADLGGGGELLVRGLDQLDAVPQRGITSARAPFISPDSRWIGFFDSGELKKVPMSGGPPIAICRVVGGTRGSSWAPDDSIVFATNDPVVGLQSVSARGGEPKVLTKPDQTHGEVDHLFPSFLPDGRTVLFTIVMNGTLENAQIAALDVTTGQRKTLVRGGTHAEYAASGHLLYASGGALRAVRFDPTRLEVLSDPVVVVDDVRTEITGAAHFSVARNGSIVYASGGGGGFEERRLVWVDRGGREQAIDAPPRAYNYPRVSPDGARIAVAIADQDQDIWVFHVARQPLTRLTFEASAEQFPVWFPDGQRLLFSSGQGGIASVTSKRADGTGPAERLTDGKAFVTPLSISPDGKWLAVGLIGGTDIGLMRLDDPRREVAPLITGPSTQGNADISPDGRWIAYQSAESGQFQIYVRPFPNVDSGRWQVSSSGGVKPVWSRNGQELFYDAARNGTLMAVPVRTATTFSFENPIKLFEGSYYARPAGRTYDVAPDGKRFLMVKGASGGGESGIPTSVVLVLNWFDDLRQRTTAR